ncbi:hypothetical protein DPMN_110072 [Dreissena polymorpha]|uniref:Uncharacterized protein n=1 Tax=Dreissena polymorpha TaxID=45954 RepID=A0A9D4QMS6_DREPO|nr:hypothetical protein DPMN_110072 [Dreissena polymorpha]
METQSKYSVFDSMILTKGIERHFWIESPRVVGYYSLASGNEREFLAIFVRGCVCGLPLEDWETLIVTF